MSSQRDIYPLKENWLLSCLAQPEYERLHALFKPVRLPRGHTLFEVGDAVRYVYFLTSGMVSLLAATSDDSTVQVAMIGSEGAVGLPVLLGINMMPYRVVMQLTGTALRISSAALCAEFVRNRLLHDAILRYLHMLITQITQSALCNRYHTIEQRLCRWLLISRDRAHSDTIELTQEALAHMLGSQRTGVTAAAAALQRRNLITYRHGKIQIVNRPALEALSCECYRVITEEIEQFMAA